MVSPLSYALDNLVGIDVPKRPKVDKEQNTRYLGQWINAPETYKPQT